MVINTNIVAQSGARLLDASFNRLSQSLARLSSGSKIVSPEDDAAGLAVSTRFDAEINRTQAARNNVGNALSFCQTQDGFLKKVSDALQRMSELSMLAQDITKGDRDRSLYNQEFQTLVDYINDAMSKDFNGVSLFDNQPLDVVVDANGHTFHLSGVDGSYVTPPPPPPPIVPLAFSTSTTLGEINPSFSNGYVVTGIDDFFIVNANTTLESLVSQLNSAMQPIASGSAAYDDETGVLSLTVNPNRFVGQLGGNPLTALGLSSVSNTGTEPVTVTSELTYLPPPVASPEPLDISTVNGAVNALTKVKSLITQVASDRAGVGANIARLNLTSEQLGVLKDNLSAANSRIKDVDVAEESTEYARYNILVQTGTAMLAQANAMPNSVLRLLS